MRYIITGGSGVIGTALTRSLAADGHEIIILSRDPSRHWLPDGARGVKWDARTAGGWGHLANGAFAVINLAGETIGGSSASPLPGTWSAERKERIKNSRLWAGEAIVAAIEGATDKPKVVYQMSGIDYYPPGDTMMTEESKRGRGFLTEVVADFWEPSTEPVEAMDVRRVVGRTAPLLNLKTGPLPASLLQFKLYAGGRLGNGKQWFSWIHTEDAVRAIRFLTETPAAKGIYNLAAPNPVTNGEFTHILGKVMNRPTFLPAPEFALKLLLGEVSALVLQGRPVSPKKLEGLGFTFNYPTLEAALRQILNK